MALASWPPSGHCQLNFEKTPFVTKIQILIQGAVGLGLSQHNYIRLLGHLDSISAMAPASGMSTGRCQLNFDKKRH